MLEAFRQIVRDEIKPLQAEQRVTNERLSKIEANQEYSLNWLDRVEQRLNPVADYVETMLLHKDTWTGGKGTGAGENTDKKVQ